MKILNIVLQPLYDQMVKHRTLRFFIGFLLLSFMVQIVFVLTVATTNIIQDQITRFTPAKQYFHYESVQYVGREGNSLVFASTSKYDVENPVRWNDILWCDNGESYRFYSSQLYNSDSVKLRPEYKTLEWNYSSPFPEGQRCYLYSKITMQVDGYEKTQILDGSEKDELGIDKSFVIEKE